MVSASIEQVTVSIVSHGHASMLENLIPCVLQAEAVGQVLITLNVPESLVLPDDPRLQVIHNVSPKGFGANHNQAFAYAHHDLFVVLNPDVVLPDGQVFVRLLTHAKQHAAAIVSPMALSRSGQREDNWRRFPTMALLFKKLFGGDGGRYLTSTDSLAVFPVDWASGFCLGVTRTVYESLRGFDERFFMYYEDVDFCLRAWRAGFRVIACPEIHLIHDAQRASHRNLRHALWHVESVIRYFGIRYGWLRAW